MAPDLNIIIAALIGFVAGFLLELGLEVWYFRRWRTNVRDKGIEELQATLRAKEARISDLEGRLERAQVRMNALQSDVAQRAQALEAGRPASGAQDADATAPEEPAPSENDPASLAGVDAIHSGT